MLTISTKTTWWTLIRTVSVFSFSVSNVTVTRTVNWIAASVLAIAFRLAVLSELVLWTTLGTSETTEAIRAGQTGSGYVITLMILATCWASLETAFSISSFGTDIFTLGANVSVFAVAVSGVLITRTVSRAIAIVLARISPMVVVTSASTSNAFQLSLALAVSCESITLF